MTISVTFAVVGRPRNVTSNSVHSPIAPTIATAAPAMNAIQDTGTAGAQGRGVRSVTPSK